jgi:hypothetical protein
MTDLVVEEDKVNYCFIKENNGKVIYTSKNDSEDKKSSVFSQGDYRPQKMNKNDNNKYNFIDVNKAISLTPPLKNEKKGRYDSNSVFSDNPIIVASDEAESEKVIIKGESLIGDGQNEEQKKINNHNDYKSNNNNNKEDNKNVNKNQEQKNQNFNVNYRVNSNINQATSAIRVNDNSHNINRNIGLNDRAQNEIDKPSFDQKFNDLIDVISKNSDISFNLINQIQKSDESTKSYVQQMTNTFSTHSSNLINEMKKSYEHSSNLINEMKKSNENTISLIQKYDELVNVLFDQKKG